MTSSRRFLLALALSLCVGAASAQTPDFDRDVLPILCSKPIATSATAIAQFLEKNSDPRIYR